MRVQLPANDRRTSNRRTGSLSRCMTRRRRCDCGAIIGGDCAGGLMRTTRCVDGCGRIMLLARNHLTTRAAVVVADEDARTADGSALDTRNRRAAARNFRSERHALWNFETRTVVDLVPARVFMYCNGTTCNKGESANHKHNVTSMSK